MICIRKRARLTNVIRPADKCHSRGGTIGIVLLRIYFNPSEYENKTCMAYLLRDYDVDDIVL